MDRSPATHYSPRRREEDEEATAHGDGEGDEDGEEEYEEYVPVKKRKLQTTGLEYGRGIKTL